MGKTKKQPNLQEQNQKKAIKMVEELLSRLKKHELLVDEQGWWQAGSPERYTFRVTATINQN